MSRVMASEVLCEVCNASPKKYKCPTCAIPYCSLACYKLHKPIHIDSQPPSAIPPSSNQPPSAPPVALTASTPPPEPTLPYILTNRPDFSSLASHPKFKHLLETYPDLLLSLQRVYAATLEPDADAESSYPSQTSGYRGRGRGRGRGGRGGWRGRGGSSFGKEGRKWTEAKGEKDGMRLLERFREGKEGDREKELMGEFVNLCAELFDEGRKEVRGDNDLDLPVQMEIG